MAKVMMSNAELAMPKQPMKLPSPFSDQVLGCLISSASTLSQEMERQTAS